jgi:hypothetical protein
MFCTTVTSFLSTFAGPLVTAVDVTCQHSSLSSTIHRIAWPDFALHQLQVCSTRHSIKPLPLPLQFCVLTTHLGQHARFRSTRTEASEHFAEVLAQEITVRDLTIESLKAPLFRPRYHRSSLTNALKHSVCAIVDRRSTWTDSLKRRGTFLRS